TRMTPPLRFPYHAPSPSTISTLSLHDALPISTPPPPLLQLTIAASIAFVFRNVVSSGTAPKSAMLKVSEGKEVFRIDCSISVARSEEHTSELQSRENHVCRLLLDKKNPNENRC